MNQRKKTTSEVVTDIAFLAFGHAKFTINELVVACWKNEPARFCLTGFPEYPDSNKVIVCVSGARGLVAKGVLTRVAPGVYSCSEKTKKEVSDSFVITKELRRVIDLFDTHLLSHSGVQEVTPQHAAALWGEHPVRVKTAQVAAFVASLQILVLYVKQLGSLTTSQGMVVMKHDLDRMKDMHDRIVDRYAKVIGRINVGGSK